MMEAIAWDELSPVFQNAVQVCVTLQIEYIWIDSLCIIQDSAEDWETEAAKMADYYEKSLLTICAASSANGSVPFLQNRMSRWEPRSFLFPNEDNSTTTIMARETPSFNDTNDRDPLFSRAWVWQESILSTRSAAYCAAGLVWDCRIECIAEDGSDGHWLSVKVPSRNVAAIEDIKPSGKKIQLGAKKGVRRLTRGYIPLRDPQLYGWRALVEDYTLHRLTVATDRLPALGGVASRLHSHLQTRYLAGLWECTLSRDLSWFRVRDTALERASSTYIAPSWSWASIGSAVTFAPPYRATFLQVVDVSCEVPGLNPFGAVSNGHLSIRGPAVRLRMKCSSPQYYFSYNLEVPGSGKHPMVFVDSVLVGGRESTVRRAVDGEVVFDLFHEVTCLARCMLHDTWKSTSQRLFICAAWVSYWL
jgi:hypothetical protein